MKRRKVKCFVFYVRQGNSLKQEVYLPDTGGWSALELAICISCGELFLIDRDNPALSNMTLRDISKQKFCPECQSALESTLRPYCLNYLIELGKVATFSEPTSIPGDQDTKTIDVWELS